MNRFDRNIRFFGEEGQQRIRNTSVGIVGTGGVGSFVALELAYLGVGTFVLVDADEATETSRNRLIGMYSADRPGVRKGLLAERLIRSIDSAAGVTVHAGDFISDRAFDLLKRTDYVFGCVDLEGARLILNEFCSAYARPLIDVASDILPGEKTRYGGRVRYCEPGQFCLYCLGELDLGEAQEDLRAPEVAAAQQAVYGVRTAFLGRTGPSVVSLNGVVASLAVTEFMLGITGIRTPKRVLSYYGHLDRMLTVGGAELIPDCYYCRCVFGKREAAGLERYIAEGFAERLKQAAGR
jgi:molybdopterin/thiamine biosynthesis adenylyltransferase